MTTIAEWENTHNVRLVRKDTDPLMELVGWILWLVHIDFDIFWTAYRLPWQKEGVVTYPSYIKNPMANGYRWIRKHELKHISRMETLWGLAKDFLLYFFFPLPIFLSGRWFVERYPILGDILAGKKTIKEAVDQLWNGYLFPWPRSWMTAWFESQIPEETRHAPYVSCCDNPNCAPCTTPE